MEEREGRQEAYRSEIISKMEAVGTYRKSFDYTISVLAKVMLDYEETTKTFEMTGSRIIIKHTNKAGASNIVKNPLYLAIEKLRDDIITYSRELGLTPAGLRRLTSDSIEPRKRSKLEEVLSSYGEE